jgi:hypothetical protein
MRWWTNFKIQGERGHVQGAGGLILKFREKEDMYKALVEGHFFLADTYLDVTRRGQPHNSSSASRYTNLSHSTSNLERRSF